MGLPWQLKLLFYAGGVYTCFLIYGILIEKLERTKFDGHGFEFWLFTTFVSSVVNAIVAYVSLRLMVSHKDAVAVSVPQSRFGWTALSQSVASASGMMALNYLDFPTQTLGKCAKPISVLVSGLIFGGKDAQHSKEKTITAILVCAGIAVFMLGKPSKDAGGQVQWQGVVLVLISLACDGIVGVLQKGGSHHASSSDQGKKEETKTKSAADDNMSYKMMLFINVWSAAIMLVVLIVKQELFEAIPFLLKHPAAFVNVIGLNISMAFGQLFIYKLIHDFDPLVCSLTTTTRKFFSILASVIVYRTPVFPMQWVGVVMVFAGLLYPELQKIASKFIRPAATTATPTKSKKD